MNQGRKTPETLPTSESGEAVYMYMTMYHHCIITAFPYMRYHLVALNSRRNIVLHCLKSNLIVHAFKITVHRGEIKC